MRNAKYRVWLDCCTKKYVMQCLVCREKEAPLDDVNSAHGAAVKHRRKYHEDDYR